MSCSDIPVYDFVLFKGDDETKRFRFKDGEGEPIDITDYVIELETNVDSLDKTAIVDDPTTGEFKFIFNREDTADLVENRVKYKVVFYQNGLTGDKTTKFAGSINLDSRGIS